MVNRSIINLYAVLLSVMLLMAGVAVQAQVYSCDFESATENREWSLNRVTRPTQLENKWYIGQPGQFGLGGTKGLYISSDADSASAVYTADGQMFTLAYRDVDTLKAGTYTILFDYRIGGSQNAKLSLWWLPQDVNIASAASAAAPTNWAAKGGVLIASALRDAKVWKSWLGRFTIPSGQSKAGRLVFVWESSQSAPVAPSACVDNIEIYAGTALCADAPKGMNYAQGVVTWIGTASSYEVCIYNAFTDSFERSEVVNTASWTPAPNQEGMQYLYVRALCEDGGHSAWVSTSEFIYIKGARCLDFYDISDNLNATGVCYTGDFDTFIRNKQKGTLGKVDFGYESAESMHTIHFLQGEIDPNTAKIDGGLVTIPQGEVASVRLGAYTDSGKSARVEYKYKVQPGMSDLLELNYAAVLQSGGHGSSLADTDMQPTLQLEVLDENGAPLESSCTQFMFMPDYGSTANWHTDGASYGAVYWCDWTMVTVSLRPYVGQTLTIRLTATRCSYDTHYAYTYFTLGCRSGDLQGIACGDFSTDHFVAPEGFTCRWYKESDPARQSILNAEGEEHFDTLHISVKDTAVYMLECHSKEDYDCFYTLTANPNPRFPVADVSAHQWVEDCQNKVRFTNRSYVAIVNRLDNTLSKSDEKVQEVIWNFGDGSPVESALDSALTHIYPDTGGVFVPYVVASMSDGICQDTLWLDTLRLDDLHTPDVDTVVHRCENVGYRLPTGELVYADTVYEWQTENRHGCMVNNSIRVQYHKNVQAERTEELCEGGYVEFEGERYTETGTYDVHLNTVYGCDSLLRLNLTILPRLAVEVPDTLVVCADAPVLNIPYTRLAGRLSGVDVRFPAEVVEQGMQSQYLFDTDEEVNIPLIDSLRPDDYTLLIDFGAPDCPADPVSVVLRVYYASSVIEQKNDLLALLNDQYNGGFSWTGYQWYCNGQPVENANTSYIVLDDSHLGDEYYCVLQRADGVLLPTCPVVYVGGKMAVGGVECAGSVYPTCIAGGQAVHVLGAKTAMMVDMMGRVVAEYVLSSAVHSTIVAPAKIGVYFLITDAYVTKIVVE